ncbi:MAG: preQ(1) synthase [Parachlamydiales bacterium]|jgi:7-cyano-7-deazaguanine reductase
MPNQKLLEIIPNEYAHSHYEVTLVCDEFTCLCPYTSKPEFATLTITYTPCEKLIEMISLKNYLASFSNAKFFQEFAINKICDDLGKALQPKSLTVKGEFSARGGMRLIPISYWNAGCTS